MNHTVIVKYKVIWGNRIGNVFSTWYFNNFKESQCQRRFGIFELRNQVTRPTYAKWRHISSY